MFSEPPEIEPLAAALLAAFIAAITAGFDAAFSALGDARLAALAQEAPERYRPALARAASDRSGIHARYLLGRLGGVAGAVVLVVRATLHLDATTAATWIAGAIAAIAILLEIATSLGRANADWLTPRALHFGRPIEMLLTPPSLITRAVAALLQRRSRGSNAKEVMEAEVERMVDDSEARGLLAHGPADIIRNALDFSDLTARDAMVPRTQVTAIQLDTPLDDVLRTISDTGHSRYPVYREHIEDAFGLLYAKDLFRVVQPTWREQIETGPRSDTPSQQASRLMDIVRQPLRVASESQPLSELLQIMRKERHHLALVVDEFGGVSGIVTLEDILEEIVGDIQDESDAIDAPIIDLGEGRLVAKGTVLLVELSAYLGLDIDWGPNHESLGGLIVDELGQIPEAGATLSYAGLELIVEEADGKRIVTVSVNRPSRVDSEPPPSGFSEPARARKQAG